MPDEPYQSLYRQYRPQRFAEVRGQDHVTLALRNAVRAGRPGHAYLFSGPRGTGKTSTARILAKALNCEALDDGEPCGVCASCLAVQAGSSLDVLELDAASNNGVDAMRDLVARAALGSPGRWKVYIVDEVHMLSTAASNALLKTLEEPPGHVVFVLATTDPQKVLPTIKSRTQHYEFHLLGAGVLGELVRDVNVNAKLGLADDLLEQVVRKGRGSARDALSALDQVAAAGVGDEEPDSAAAILDGMAHHDVGAALRAVAVACSAGRDPRRIASDVIERLRRAFLVTLAPALADVPPQDIGALEEQAGQLGVPAVVRAMEVLGDALVTMRDALDTRVTLEVALVRICAAEADTSVPALLERIERLERRIAAGAILPSPADHATEPSSTPALVALEQPEPPASRASLGAFRKREAPSPSPPPAAAPPTVPASPGAPPGASLPDRDEITKAWGDTLLSSLPPGARSIYRTGRWLSVDPAGAVFAVPNAFHLDRAEVKRREVEDVLYGHFGVRVPIRLVEDSGEPAALAPADDERTLSSVDLAEMETASTAAPAAEARLKSAFPGAEELTT